MNRRKYWSERFCVLILHPSGLAHSCGMQRFSLSQPLLGILFSLLAANANPGYKVTVNQGSGSGFYNKDAKVTCTSNTKPKDTTSGWQVEGNVRYQTKTTYTYKNGATYTINSLQAPQTVTMGYNTKTEQINRQYKLTINPASVGSANKSSDWYAPGQSVSVTYTASGYKCSWASNPSGYGSSNATTNFNMPSNPVTLTASVTYDAPMSKLTIRSMGEHSSGKYTIKWGSTQKTMNTGDTFDIQTGEIVTITFDGNYTFNALYDDAHSFQFKMPNTSSYSFGFYMRDDEENLGSGRRHYQFEIEGAQNNSAVYLKIYDASGSYLGSYGTGSTW